MAMETNAVNTYGTVGNKEDIQDKVYNLDPFDTPLMTAAGRVPVSQRKHEWQTDSLEDVNADNAHLEGDVITIDARSPTVMEHNVCQIFRKSYAVTETQQAVKSYGRDNEFNFIGAKAAKELKRDIEAVICRNQGYVEGNSTTPRKLRSMESWIKSNVSMGASGGNATAPTNGRTDGDQRTLTEEMVQDVMQSCWENGAEPTMIMAGGWNKRQFSKFDGRAGTSVEVGLKTIQATADLYASDFGDIKIMPSRFMRSRTVMIIDPAYLKLGFLRPISKDKLSHVSDAVRGYVDAELTLCMGTEKSQGIIADLNTAAT